MKNKEKVKILGILLFTVFMLSSCSQNNIVIGETCPEGLFDILLVYPISYLLNFILNLSNNGVISIIVTTIIIVIITSPLEIFSQVETKKQQDLQPYLQKLKEKYPNTKTDKKQQQAYAIEMQKIYSERGMSLFGMCLPVLLMMFIQLPLLMAMNCAVTRLKILKEFTFNLFNIEYKLGQADPGLYFIPHIGSFLKIFIIMTIVVMFLTQYYSLDKNKRNPKTNPMVNQLFFMNILFIFFFWNQPIALAIYWTVSNLLRLIIRIGFVNNIVNKQYISFNKKQKNKLLKK